MTAGSQSFLVSAWLSLRIPWLAGWKRLWRRSSWEQARPPQLPGLRFQFQGAPGRSSIAKFSQVGEPGPQLSSPLGGLSCLLRHLSPISHLWSLRLWLMKLSRGAAGALAKPPGPGVKEGCCPPPPPWRASPPRPLPQNCSQGEEDVPCFSSPGSFSKCSERDSQMAAAEPWQQELCFLSPPPMPPGSSVSESAHGGWVVAHRRP